MRRDRHLRRIPLALAIGLLACAGGAPLTLDSASPRAVDQVRECVVDGLRGEGYSIIDRGSDDGVLRAERVYQRPDTSMFLGMETVENLIEWAHLEATFDRSGDSTSIRLVAATSQERDGRRLEPTPPVVEGAEEIAEGCR